MPDSAWRRRLEAAIENSGKSKRAISLGTGLGPGYVHSILAEGKDPTLEKLLAVCEQIPSSPIHIILGVDAKPRDEFILRAMNENPSARQAILALLGAPSTPE